MGCIGCLPSASEQDADRARKTKLAKEDAIKNEKTYFIYRDEAGVWQYMEETAARAIGIQPTGGIVSNLQ